MRSDARVMAACYRERVLSIRLGLAFLVAFALLAGRPLVARAETPDASTADGGGVPCASASSEETCLERASCAWGVGGAGMACFDVGAPVEVQPGSGDPGGGGGQAGVLGESGSDEGCSASGSTRTRSGLELMLAAACLVVVGRRATVRRRTAR